MPGPLAGVRVLELTSVVLGPWACQILGDLGADVVKVEPPTGDSNRQAGPARHPGMAALFLTCNRNKRSLVLDLKQEAGRRALLKLAETADVLVHNFRPAAQRRLGLDYDAVRKLNPRIVFCGTYGYARKGPYRDRAAYDDLIQAACGLATLAERLGDEPRYLPTLAADKTAGLAVVYSVIAALFHRERTGEGQELEVPMFETLVSYVMAEHLFGGVFEPGLGSAGYSRLLTRNRRPFKTKDGYIALLPYLDEQWTSFCTLAGRAELAEDARFSSLASRLAHIDEVYREVGEIAATKSTAEWLELLGDRVPAMTVCALEDLFSDPQLEASGFWQFLDHPSEGRMRVPGVPTRFAASPGSVRRLAPRLGEHSLEVLREAGLSQPEIESLLASGATRTPGS